MKKAYLLSWNPEIYPWDEIDSEIEHIKLFGSVPEDWRCRSKKPKNGDLVFIISVGNTIDNGIIASGIVDCIVENAENKLTRRLYFDLNVIIKPDIGNKILKTKYLKNKFPVQKWEPQSSGIEIRDEIYEEFIDLWNNFINNNYKEFSYVNNYYENISPQKLYTPYERNPKARIECIKHYGCICEVCKNKMEDIYGEIGKNFIHVHHIKFISTFKEKHLINPIKDLITVCPNCHSMLHRKLNGKYLSIEELRKLIC